MTALALADLLVSLREAFEIARTAGDEQHLRQLDRYLHDDGTPITRRIKVPDATPGGADQWDDLDVPLLALIPSTSVQIKRLVFDVDVDVDAIAVDLGAEPDAEGGIIDVSDGHVRTSARLLIGEGTDGSRTGRLRIVVESDRPTPAHCAGESWSEDESTPPDAVRGYSFTVRSALIGEREIDVHDEAQVLVSVELVQHDPDTIWEIESAMLLLDLSTLPPTMTVLAANATWERGHLRFDLGSMRAGEIRELPLRLATGSFVGGGPADPGDYTIDAVVESRFRTRRSAEVRSALDPIVIHVAAD